MPSAENPYPPGSARYKLWERREADRRAKEKAKPKPKAIDDEVREELERRPGYFKRRNAQSTDSNQ